MTTPNFPSIDFPFALPAALVVIDLQPCGVDPRFGLAKALETGRPGFTAHLVERMRTFVVPGVNRLLAAFHDAGQPVFLTAFASAAGDGSDVRTASIRYRDAQRRAETGSSVVLPRSDPATDIITGLDVRPGDTVLTKMSMDSFATTDLADRLARHGARAVVVCGVYSDACVESTARNAAELGYQVFVAEDACAAWDPAFHAASMASLGRYFARIDSSEAIAAMVARAALRT
ncbi:MAG: cysteine hydrolase family protein [Alphaproteobacteria bacterium]